MVIEGNKMMKKYKNMALGRICAGCLVGCLAFSAVVSAKTDLTNQKVEYQKTPLGIEVMKPRFSWQMVADDNQRGWKQTAYEISVTYERGKLVWNSGKVESDNSLNIAYTGEPLSPHEFLQSLLLRCGSGMDVQLFLGHQARRE